MDLLFCLLSMTDHIQNGQDERAGDTENSDHDAMHRIPYHVGDRKSVV